MIMLLKRNKEQSHLKQIKNNFVDVNEHERKITLN